ncbi:MAG: U32 family peptidase [Oscillospiraceae bacterium]|nr:U32 family peptidase [Oscillospiraceae bacterium]
MPEILAPAGGMEQLTAAVRSGANTVYLGVQDFNARRNAANFDAQTLPEAVSYCHARDVKVYVTVNIAVLDSELEMLERSADMIASSGADAVIIQDLAVLKLFKEKYPTIKRYASTQTAVHNVDGALFLRDMGFDSVVLARELTLDEMRKICSTCGIKTEAFIHGAHCMSLSGACYLSSMIGGRSGNRGLCAQPCRLDWRCGGCDHVLSLKDMSLIGHIREMADAGVDSFKIEGRMKRPEYVSAAVTACKNALLGSEYDIGTLRAVFSRSGFTDGYLTGKRDASMFGYRTKEDVADASSVLGAIAFGYRNEAPLVPVDMSFVMDSSRSVLTVTDGSVTISAEGHVPQAARTKSTDAEAARNSLSKTGGTPFCAESITADIEEGLFLPASELNRMRRDALGSLLEKRSAITPHEAHPFSFPSYIPYRSQKEKPELWGRFYDPDTIPDKDVLSRVIVPSDKVTPELIAAYGDRLTVQLPAALFPEDEPAMHERLEILKHAGAGSVWADNIYGIRLGKDLNLRVYGGFGLNVTNSSALSDMESLGLSAMTVSFEISMKQIKDLGGRMPRGIAVYGSLPLMHYRNCPVRASIGCAACRGHGSLTDRMDVSFPVECCEKKFSTLLNSVPLHIAERDLTGLDFSLLWFTRETASEVKTIIGDFENCRKTSRPRTSGLYYRELL